MFRMLLTVSLLNTSLVFNMVQASYSSDKSSEKEKIEKKKNADKQKQKLKDIEEQDEVW